MSSLLHVVDGVCIVEQEQDRRQYPGNRIADVHSGEVRVMRNRNNNPDDTENAHAAHREDRRDNYITPYRAAHRTKSQS